MAASSGKGAGLPAPAAGGGGGAATALAFAALLVGAAALTLALRGRPAAGSGGAEVVDDSDLFDRDSMENRLDDMETRMERLQSTVDAMAKRVADTERAAGDARGLAGRALDLARGGAAPGGPIVEGPDDVPADAEGRARYLRELLAGLEAGTFDTREVWEKTGIAAGLGALDDAVKAVETFAARKPDSAAARVLVGTARLQRVDRAPDTAARALRIQEAVDAFDAALALDPDHWEARYLKAFNLGQAPAMMGRRGEAVGLFRALADLQETRAPEPRFADTYVQWGRVLVAEGDPDGARRAYERGIRFFPSDGRLADAMRALDGK